MNRNQLSFAKISFIVIIGLFSGCTGFDVRETKHEGLPTKHSSNETALFTENSTPVYTDTPMPRTTHSPIIASDTPKPEISSSPTEVKSTWTPLATLSAEDSSRLIKKLLAENPNCRLPCWWGITPGQTKQEEAAQMMGAFTTIDRSYDDVLNIKYNTSPGISSGFTLFFSNWIVWMIRIHPESTRYNFQIDQLLKNYGKPNEVLIWTMASAPFHPIPFVLVLDYTRYQFKAIFDLTVEKEGDFLRSCPTSVGPWLYMWDPNDPTSLNWIEKNAYGLDRTELKQIEDVTDMNIEEFQSTFINPGACIMTHKDNW